MNLLEFLSRSTWFYYFLFVFSCVTFSVRPSLVPPWVLSHFFAWLGWSVIPVWACSEIRGRERTHWTLELEESCAACVARDKAHKRPEPRLGCFCGDNDVSKSRETHHLECGAAPVCPGRASVSGSYSRTYLVSVLKREPKHQYLSTGVLLQINHAFREGRSWVPRFGPEMSADMPDRVNVCCVHARMCSIVQTRL